MITNIIIVEMIGAIGAGAILGAIIGFWVLKKMAKGEVDSAKKYKEKTINEAHRKAKTIKKEAMLRAKDSLYRMKLDFEKETKEKREQLLALERRLFHKEETLDKKIEQYEQREKAVAKREKEAAGIEEALKRNQTEDPWNLKQSMIPQSSFARLKTMQKRWPSGNPWRSWH
jgi:ribonuclease Y